MSTTQKKKVLTYQERRAISAEERSKEELLNDVEEVGLQIQSDILATKKKLIVAKRDLEGSYGAFPFCTTTVLENQDTVKGLETAIKDAEAVAKLLGFDIN